MDYLTLVNKGRTARSYSSIKEVMQYFLDNASKYSEVERDAFGKIMTEKVTHDLVVVELASMIPVLTVARHYTNIDPEQKQEWWGRCPICKVDNIVLDIEGDTWSCDTCQKVGDGIDLVRQVEKTDEGRAALLMIAIFPEGSS